ncbi:GH92 family glycosyl hydrolase [Variovorax sp. EL159]|uniref:GH92 family glycosyl hydrolase n=1 Tax=Variovorax sp. EL159 TaxID=1566270 RepID=UPI00088CF2B9|nr:GH92 family glycosyl hydrolase [Variovorax sp. EL159]SCX64798.1 alpha-1,2-mannosidase, putative [Variovorax sp. EL159]
MEKKSACGNLAAGLVAVSLLGGCGGGSSGGFSGPLPMTTTATTTTTPTATSTPPDASEVASGPVARPDGGTVTPTPTPAPAPAPAADSRVDIPALTKYVNLFVGTKISDTGSGHSGNVNPGAQTPFGMVSFGPDTKGSNAPWGFGSGGYYYDDKAIRYFSMTHLNGPGCRGQGAVALLPNSTNAAISSDGLSYDKANQSAAPGYYKVKFDNGITSELTATTRTGMAKISYTDKDKAFLVIDSARNNPNQEGVPYTDLTDIKLSDDRKSVSGTAVANEFCGGTWKQPVYYYATFDKPLKASSAVSGKAAILQFDLGAADLAVQVKVGISSVSTVNARKNLDAENADWSFATVRTAADNNWNSRLNVVQLDLAKAGEIDKVDAKKKDDAVTQLTKFYTALYRVYSGPTVYSDVNGDYRSMKQVDLSQSNDVLPTRANENVANYKFKVDGKDAGYKTHYSGFSMWDTYRSQSQLLALIAPDEASEMIQSLVADAQQCGAFPHWVDGSEDTVPMNGDHAPTVVAGSYLFGARKFDLATARKFMLQSVGDTNSQCNDKFAIGKPGDSRIDYIKLGWIPSDRQYDKPSSTTLEAITTDRSVGAFLDALPDTRVADDGVIQKVFKRAGNWQNIFNDATKSLQSKTAAGDWSGSGDFHESTEQNYIWTFAYDWTRLVDKLGGRTAALKRLSDLFSVNAVDPTKGPDPSGRKLNGGESSSGYYIGNEPAFQTPWAYNWIGSAKYAQYIIPVILKKNFSLGAGGLPGNDDMGATSGWYVWAAMGLYPVIPSAPGLAVSTPQFSGMTLWLGNGKKLRIEADRQALLDDVRYIGEMKLNGTAYAGSWLPLDKIRGGGTLSFTLSPTPTDWASDPALTPPSGPAADYTKATASPG